MLKQNNGVETFGILTKILFKCENTFHMFSYVHNNTQKNKNFKENSFGGLYVSYGLKKTEPKCEREVKGRFRNLWFYCVYKCRKSEGCKGGKRFLTKPNGNKYQRMRDFCLKIGRVRASDLK